MPKFDSASISCASDICGTGDKDTCCDPAPLSVEKKQVEVTVPVAVPISNVEPTDLGTKEGTCELNLHDDVKESFRKGFSVSIGVLLKKIQNIRAKFCDDQKRLRSLSSSVVVTFDFIDSVEIESDSSGSDADTATSVETIFNSFEAKLAEAIISSSSNETSGILATIEAELSTVGVVVELELDTDSYVPPTIEDIAEAVTIVVKATCYTFTCPDGYGINGTEICAGSNCTADEEDICCYDAPCTQTILERETTPYAPQSETGSGIPVTCATGYSTTDTATCNADNTWTLPSCEADKCDVGDSYAAGTINCLNGGEATGQTGACACDCTDGYSGSTCEVVGAAPSPYPSPSPSSSSTPTPTPTVAAKCSSFSCPSETSLKANAASIQCAADVCVTSDQSTCCEDDIIDRAAALNSTVILGIVSLLGMLSLL